MFVVIPAAAAAAIAALGERVLSGERVESHTRWLVGLVPFGLIALAGPLAAAAVAFAAIVAVAWPEIRRSGERWTSPIVTVAGRVALAGGAVLAAGSLVRDALDVL